MIFVLLHATLGWLLAAGACALLGRRSAAIRCWAWRLGLLKGPFALLLAIPIAVLKPAPTGPAIARPPVSGGDFVPSEEPRKPSAVSPAANVRSPSRGPSPSSLTPTGTERPPFDVLTLLYGTGVVAVALARLAAARRVHPGMPRVVGVVRPRIVIPEGLDPDAAAMAYAHEAAHVRRRDPLWSFVADVVCAAFWFAPPVWLCARGMRAEAEAACDAAAVEATAASRKAYARLLLDFAGAAPANALGGPARRLARRILMLENRPKPLSRPLATGLVALGLLALLPWRAVAAQTPSDVAPGKERRSPVGARVYAVRLPLESAAGLILDEPGVRRRIGWTAAQDAALEARTARGEAVVAAYRAEMARRQTTGALKAFFDWDARERAAMFARAKEAEGPMPWTPDQERALKAMALARFGSALWASPEIADRLGLTFAQKAAIYHEDTAIGHAAWMDVYGTPTRPVKEMPKAVTERLKALNAAYLAAPREKRAALQAKIANLQRPFVPVYADPTSAARRASYARSWRMRANADRRLATKLTSTQRTKLEELQRTPSAWLAERGPTPRGPEALDLAASVSTKKGTKLFLSDDFTIDGRRPQDFPVHSNAGTLVRTLYSFDGSVWKIYAEGERAPYRYSVERIAAPQQKGKAAEPARLPWTEASIRRTLHLGDNEALDFKPDPDRPGTEVAEVADRKGVAGKYRIDRRTAADGTVAYDLVEAVFTVRANRSEP